MENVEATANSKCTCASEFNNRAIALMELGRYIEAQRDFDRACSLEHDPSYLLNAAELFLTLGMKERALENVHKVRQLAGSGDVTNPQGLYYVARMFLKCNEPESAEEALIVFLQFLQSVIPHTVKDDSDGYIIRKDGHTVHIWPSIIDFDNLDHFIHVLSEVKSGKGITEIKRLLRKTKREISCTWGDAHQETGRPT